MVTSQEDSDPREPHTSERFSPSERRTMLESTLSEEKSRRETRPSTNHQRSKDSSLKRDLEERASPRETSSTDSRRPRKTKPSTTRFSLSTSRRRRLPTFTPKLPQPRLKHQRPPQQSLLPQPSKPQLQPRLLPQRRSEFDPYKCE